MPYQIEHSDSHWNESINSNELFLQVDFIENYNESLAFLKSLTSEVLPTNENIEDNADALNVTGSYHNLNKI